VNDLIKVGEDGNLDGCEVFMYTDNKTAEGAYCRGSALSRALFELIVTLYKLQMRYAFILHMVWIAGTRMITNGLATIGVSWSSMVSFHLSATERAPQLLEWIKGWLELPDLQILNPEGWFTEAHSPGDVGWFPTPAAADAAIGQFCEALHKRPYYFHVFAIPLIMTNLWHKQLLKETDINFVVKPCTEIWGAS
jgi:hypothetical protein